MLRDEKGRFKKGNKGFWTGKKRPNMSGAENSRWAGNRIKRICETCGTTFRRSDNVIAGKPKYCSSKCYGISKKKDWEKEKNPNWRGGTTTETSKIRNSDTYKQWRMKVLQRDRFRCVKCGYRSKQSFAHGDRKCDIRVDHIKPFSLYPKLRFQISNGRTLCIPCDKVYGWNYHRDRKLQEPSETTR